MIEFYCMHCGNRICVDDEFGGQKGTCGRCRSTLVAPMSSTVPVTNQLPVTARAKTKYAVIIGLSVAVVIVFACIFGPGIVAHFRDSAVRDAETKYLQHLTFEEWGGTENPFEIPGVGKFVIMGKILNEGSRTVNDVQITIYSLDRDGRVMREYTSWDEEKIISRPGYSRFFVRSLPFEPYDYDIKITGVRFGSQEK